MDLASFYWEMILCQPRYFSLAPSVSPCNLLSKRSTCVLTPPLLLKDQGEEPAFCIFNILPKILYGDMEMTGFQLFPCHTLVNICVNIWVSLGRAETRTYSVCISSLQSALPMLLWKFKYCISVARGTNRKVTIHTIVMCMEGTIKAAAAILLL